MPGRLCVLACRVGGLEREREKCEPFSIIVWFHMNLFCIERGFYSRTEIGEREIDGSTVHIMGAVGNKTLCGCLPLPPLPLA
jgi:hypothetical protein